MKLVITDGYTLNPGDLDWSPLQRFGNVVYFDSTSPEEVVDRCRDADIIITNKTIIPARLIEESKNLKLIAVSATGVNNVDVDAAKRKGVLVKNVPEYGTYSVAQHTFALLLELVNHTAVNIASTKKDEWASELWSYTRNPITELKDKIMGIVGFGRIGKRVAIIAEAFGMEVIFSNRSQVKNASQRQVEIDELFSVSDVVTLHCPLSESNQGFVNEKLLRSMKPGALLINTSRGGLINEDDLLHALDRGWIAMAALDVLTVEPPAAMHPLIHHPKCLVTPHNAWISYEARSRLMQGTIKNIDEFIKVTTGKVKSET